ncbi:hypothetical protein NA78x_003473 [Anatilimnocola sp. NA78]|uniref:hypothetical protein n=1 Tax=Anatilimnocola sp. NA78 TaxID=3415683 RepID=UPI003CE5649F
MPDQPFMERYSWIIAFNTPPRTELTDNETGEIIATVTSVADRKWEWKRFDTEETGICNTVPEAKTAAVLRLPIQPKSTDS